MNFSIPSDYFDTVANIESGGNPFAVNGSSSASGLYGFTKSTFTGLGQSWSNVFNPSAQQAAMQQLTQQNASALSRNGLDITTQNLYTAHFLGAANAVNVLNSDNSTPLHSVVPGRVIASNPNLAGMNVGDFKDWTASKIAGNAAGGSGSSGGNEIGNDISLASSAAELAAGVASFNPIAIGDAVSKIFFGGGKKSTSQGDGSSSGNIFSWITDFFSAHTATRFAFVVIGIILVGVAVIYLAANTDTGKTVINNTKEVAKTVATTAVVAA